MQIHIARGPNFRKHNIGDNLSGSISFDNLHNCVCSMSLTEHVGTLAVYSPICINATTCSSVSISKVSLALDSTIVLLAKLTVGTNLVGVVPGGPVNG